MKPIKIDRKGPRMRKGKYSRQVVSKEAWKDFIENNPDYRNMTWNEFYQNWKEIAETIRNEVVTNPLGVKLGFYTGELKVQYLPHKFDRAMDKTASEEAGEHLTYVNLVTRGKVAIIKWERRWAVKFNRMLQFFAFESNREINKLAETYIKSHPDSVRTARNTMGGYSIWRQLKAKSKFK